LPGKSSAIGRIIGNAVAWGFREREADDRTARTFPGSSSAIRRAGLGLLDSQITRAAVRSIISIYLTLKPRIETSVGGKTGLLVEYFNSLGRKRKVELVYRLAYDQVIRSLKRHRRSIEGANGGGGFSYLTAIALSIGGSCNLECESCLMRPFQSPSYAGIEDLDYIFGQAENLGVSFITIMGAGEPFLEPVYAGKLLECMKRHGSIYFFVYTNGTTVTRELAGKAGGLDNLFMLVSTEGLKESHDSRRGAGTHESVMNACRLLREHGIPFGYSAVVHFGNYREVTSIEFIDGMAEAGALIGCYNQSCGIFQPGRGDFTRESRERNEYYHLIKNVNERSPIHVVDLFNLEEERYGCRAKKGTSCFVDAVSGKVSPCFLFPFASDDSNIYDRRGESRLEEILRGDFYNYYRTGCSLRRLCIRDVGAELDHFYRNPWLGVDDRERIESLMEVVK
jgi:MoaA/NifB/PqqE/SkfB family radical SAM enzyme